MIHMSAILKPNFKVEKEEEKKTYCSLDPNYVIHALLKLYLHLPRCKTLW